jgi:ATP-binding cassette subfamily B protein
LNATTHNNTGFLSSLAAAAKPYRGQLAFGLTAAAVTSALEVVSPMILKSGVDLLRSGRPVGWLYGFAGLLVLVAAVGGVFRFYMRKVVISVSRLVESDLRENFFRHLLALSPSFFDRNHTGDLMARATDDVERVRLTAGPGLLYSVNTGLVMLFSSVMMFYLDPVLAAMVLLLAPLIGGTVLAVARRLYRANLRQQEVYGELSSQVQENISGFRVVKAFVREVNESARFGEVCGRYLKRSLKVARLDAVFMPTLALLVGVGVIGILYVGGTRVITEKMTLGELVAFMSYLTLMTWPMVALGWVTHLYQRGGASHVRLRQILSEREQFGSGEYQVSSDKNQESRTDLTSQRIDAKAPEIEYRRVNFRYRDEGPDVLADLNLTIPSGSTVAIVGRTGSGKSTIVRLLARLYHPQAGEILIDGERWDKLPAEELRARIGYVDQQPFLYSATIRDNICFGADPPKLGRIDDPAMTAAAYTACFDDDVAGFPDGYDTRIGERGVTLSGGQQQRLALARALLADTPILVLDDCLSAVDADTEQRIIERLAERLEGHTTLLVTHRLAAAELADSIAVIAGGRVAESGSHDDLIARDGLYAAMYSRQMLEEEIGALK